MCHYQAKLKKTREQKDELRVLAPTELWLEAPALEDTNVRAQVVFLFSLCQHPHSPFPELSPFQRLISLIGLTKTNF